MKFRTAELTGKALDYAVEMAQGFTFQRGMPEDEWTADPDCRKAIWRKAPEGHWNCMRCTEGREPSTEWNDGGLIIDRENVEFVKCNDLHFPHGNENGEYIEPYIKAMIGEVKAYGPTHLVAAMRCFVLKELGDEVDIPDDLLI